MTVEALSFPGVSRRLNLTRVAGVPWCSKNAYGPSEVSWRSSRFPATAPDSKSLYRRELWIREKAHALHLDRQPRFSYLGPYCSQAWSVLRPARISESRAKRYR